MNEDATQTGGCVQLDDLDDPRWDAFTELALTMADDLFPTAVPLQSGWPVVMCRNIVNYLLTDGDMRELLEDLLARTPRPAHTGRS